MRGKNGRSARAVLALCAVLLLLAAACGGTAEDSSGGGGDAAGDDGGGAAAGDPSEIVIAIDTESRTLASPEGYAAETGQVTRQIQEPLVDRDQETGDLIGILATDWEPVDDTTWRFHLREGVEFHDGEPFNAEAAAFAINWNYSHETGDILRSFRGPEFEAVVVDEYTIDIVLESPDPILPRRMVLGPLGSKKQIEEDVEAWEQAPIGTGPYKFVEWNRGNSATVELNENWWGHDSPDSDGEATIERATFVFRPDHQSIVSAIAAGEADVGPNVADELCQNEIPDLCFVTEGLQMAHIRLDHMNPVLGDIRIRQAMALAVDKELLSEDLLPGTPASMMVPPGAAGYNEDLEPYPFDMDTAKELVEEAKADGVPVDETPLTIVYERGKFPQGEAAGQYLLAQFTEIGLQVEFQVMEPALLLADLVEPDPPPGPERGWIAFHSHSNRLGDYESTLGAWVVCGAPISTYCNEEVQELYEEAVPIPSGEERDAALEEVARVVYEDYGNIPLVYLGVTHAVGPRVEWDFRADTLPYLKNMRIVE